VADVPPPAVAAELYDEAYYRQSCAGAEAWQASGGKEIDPLYPWALKFARLAPGETVLDVGCGRGELLVAARDAGAAKAIGVEYSEAALELAKQTIAAHDAGDRCEALYADARGLPIEDASIDLLTLLDVVEHLTPTELAAALTEAHRVLKPGGRVFVHTMPNRYIFTVTYRLLRALMPWRLRSWPANPRTEHERLMHVNEMTLGELSSALQSAGFTDARSWFGEWVRTDFLPQGRLASGAYNRLSRVERTKWLAVADLWAEGVR
jgi:ubiquinone/menaquinone biosynthesis C-methylase UbiE